jgi:AhpD family alkylhydroperoxidase
MSQITHEPRMERSHYDKIAPAVSTALQAIGKAVDESGLEKPLTELIKVRASQINGCAFCLQYHLNLARKLEVSPTKLDLVAVWREAAIFSARDRAALAWTEALTLIAGNHVTDTLYTELQRQFSESEIALLTAAIGAINFWNRLAGSMGYTPPASTSP